MSTEEYVQSIQKWRDEMDANLRRENSWLAMAGLFWLKNGFNTFGSSRDCDILLPRRVERLIGAFEFDGMRVTLHLEIGQSVNINGEVVQNIAALKTDREEPPSFIRFEDLQMLIIQRAERHGIYLWDNQRAQRREYPPRIWFPIDEKYRVSGVYTPYPVPIKVELPNSIGEFEKDFMQGYVSFRIGDKSLRLDATELNDGRLFLQFKDKSNEEQTYQYGRYLYTEPVKEDGQVYLDFNKCFNPPSAFTDYATFTFGTKQNRLNISMDAGELFNRSG
jgi:uncharacterized protein (DUF1684 family)